MRTTNISPEFKYVNVNGTLSMLEKRSFLGSKLIKFDDNINIESENIIYYQTADNEQLNINVETTLAPIIYNTVADKLTNSTLIMDSSQTSDQQNNNTKWILTININTLLINYLFATLKKYRTFENVQNSMVLSNDVDSSITEYIMNNLLSRYQFYHIDLFISYNNLLNGGLRYGNNWDQKVELSTNLTNTYQKNIDANSTELTITFNQAQPSSTYSFNYYYNLYFTKI